MVPSQGTHSPILTSGCIVLVQTSTPHLITKGVLSQLGPLMLPKSTPDGHTTQSQTGTMVRCSNSSSTT